MSEKPVKILNHIEDPTHPPTVPNKRCAHPRNQIRLKENSCEYTICPLTYEQLLNIMGSDCRYERKPLKCVENTREGK